MASLGKTRFALGKRKAELLLGKTQNLVLLVKCERVREVNVKQSFN